MSSVVRLILDHKVLSLLNLSRMYSQALLTGIALKSDTTTNETVTRGGGVGRLGYIRNRKTVKNSAKTRKTANRTT